MKLCQFRSLAAMSRKSVFFRPARLTFGLDEGFEVVLAADHRLAIVLGQVFSVWVRTVPSPAHKTLSLRTEVLLAGLSKDTGVL